MIAFAVDKALSGDALSLVHSLPPVLRYPSRAVVATILFWKSVIKLFINLAVPSTFVPTDIQRLKAAVAARKKAQKDHTLTSSTSTDSLPSLIHPGSPTYSSVPGDLNFGILDTNDNDNDFELPPLDYVPPTPEDIKRWVELSFEKRRKVADMSVNGLNWMKWGTASQPLPSTRARDLPEGIPAWREEWSCYDLPENPRHIPTSDDLRRWWAEATDEDCARINRICVDGLNWRTWTPAPQGPCDEENVVWSDIGAWDELENEHKDYPDHLSILTDLPTTTGTTHGNGSEQPAL